MRLDDRIECVIKPSDSHLVIRIFTQPTGSVNVPSRLLESLDEGHEQSTGAAGRDPRSVGSGQSVEYEVLNRGVMRDSRYGFVALSQPWKEES
jgi:hypothetical protein